MNNLLLRFTIKAVAHPYRTMSNFIEIPVQTNKLIQLTKTTIVPKLNDNRHKGQYGRIGIIGGSLEYTGAPYFAAYTSLKVGADLAHVFCSREAAACIKSYSPELIVHPLLDVDDALQKIEPWLERLHVLVVGPGLGRDPNICKTVINLINMCLKINKPLIIDADGLFLLNENIDIISGQRNIILTPNAIEFQRLFSNNDIEKKQKMSKLGRGVIVLEKGMVDKIHLPSTGEIYTMPTGGSGRRCGGQGDLLCGSLAIFFHWCLESNQSNPGFLAAFAASYLVKQCNYKAYQKHRRGMLATDMLNEISGVFNEIFENTDVC
ncbi:ATP-dependent (S)-NAD(P)H-hydrate dehydratase-like [Teleopsis dalmanni]|uniref:ATP-dependent (S)-NAD(P)H-hydrate dehydratase-like n=1 Tax=Teleopsis dalmanni TaxID=139649 RepID=UPI0018CDC385|nr:ATP-dependent (S)-NAD(P)H-hydrate dehydratase-like [Teleopsis dalmanni]XP_037956419.1 ATP-dependent (S)-NAD(P)H-hydrate dehydratase-like [Teleopsis dalmanni]